MRTYLYDLIKSQRDATQNPNNITAPAALNAMTPDQWAGLILDAAEVMDDRNAAMTRLGVSKDVALALIKLKDSGNRFMDISGKGGDTIGAFDLTGVVGDLMRVPVYLLPKLRPAPPRSSTRPPSPCGRAAAPPSFPTPTP